MIKTTTRQKAYTIIEMLIFMAMMSILLVTLTNIFSSIIDVRLESESTSIVDQDGNFILNRFMYDIGRAQSINIPNAVGLTDSSLSLAIDGSTYVYSLIGTDLSLSINGASPVILNSIDTGISELNFTRIGNSDGSKDTIQLAYKITSKIQQTSGVEASKYYQTTVGLR